MRQAGFLYLALFIGIAGTRGDASADGAPTFLPDGAC